MFKPSSMLVKNIFNKVSDCHFLRSCTFYTILLLLTWGFSFKSFSQQIYIGPGAYLVMRGQPFLQVNNASFKNDGNFVPDLGTVKFTGAADTSIAFISGTEISSIDNILINKSAYGLALKSQVT